MKNVNPRVKRKLGFSVCSSVTGVVPPFYIIVCADSNHEDGLTGGEPRGAEKPKYLLHTGQTAGEEASLPGL